MFANNIDCSQGVCWHEVYIPICRRGLDDFWYIVSGPIYSFINKMSELSVVLTDKWSKLCVSCIVNNNHMGFSDLSFLGS